MATYRVLSWRGIPAQVKVFTENGRPRSAQLSERFQLEIDRVAMRDELIESDAYIGQWSWGEPQERDGSADEVLAAVIAELEASFHAIRRSGGITKPKEGDR